MVKLFDVEVPAISKHLTNIFVKGELPEDATVSKMEIVQQEGKRQVEYYSLGYRVNSKKATHFRIWAIKVLKEYMIKGFAFDDERLKQGKLLLERIILKSCWSEFVLFVRANVEFGSRLQIFSQNAALIMIRILRLHRRFMLWFRISFIMRLRSIQ